MARVWSHRQAAVIQWMEDAVERVLAGGAGRSLLVWACPGSGKTTILEEIIKNHTAGLDALLLAFNRDIVAVLKLRITNQTVRTIHSFGLGMLLKNGIKGIVDDDKEEKILARKLDKYLRGYMFWPVLQLVSFAKKNLLEDWSDVGLGKLADFYGIQFDGEEDIAYDVARYVLDRSAKELRTYSFDDMVWLPWQLKLNIKKFSIVGLDEAQDASPAAMWLIQQAMRPDSIFIGVGDENQAINGFAGAGIDSMKDLKEMFNADVLPLDITYRCPISVVEYVNGLFPGISFVAGPNAIQGKVGTGRMETTEFVPGDMVLCRTNAPLVRPCYSLIRRGIKASIKGRDIGKGMISFMQKFKVQTVTDLIPKMMTYVENETYKLRLAKKDGQAIALEDKAATILALADGCSTVSEVIDKCRLVFDDTKPAVQFSSAHRSKGLEANNVFILAPELMPHPMAKLAWEKEQEDHVKFVAHTRSKEALIFISE